MIGDWIVIIFVWSFFYLVMGVGVLLTFSMTVINVIHSPNTYYLNEKARHQFSVYAAQNPLVWLILAIWPLALIFVGAYYVGLAFYYRYIAKGNCEIYIHAWVNNFLKERQK